MESIKRLRRLQTGVPGLDVVLQGGLFEAGVYLIEGPPGSGKTMLASQICFGQAERGKRAVYCTLLTEAHERLLSHLSSLTFFQAEFIPEQLTFVSGFNLLESNGLAGVIEGMREVLARTQPAVLVIDGLISAVEQAGSNNAFKKFVHELQGVASLFRCTVLLLTSTGGGTRLPAEHTTVDGVIELRSGIVRLKPQRQLEVLKLRGSGFLGGTHTIDLGEQGVTVYPRLETVLSSHVVRVAPAGEMRRPFDIAGLDAMLGGGLPSPSNTMFMGPSGVGKTVLGLHFLAAGLAAGERVMCFTFYEQPQELVAKASALGLDLAGPLASGQLRIMWQSSVEASVDRMGHRLVTAFREQRASRLFIDGIQGFMATADPGERIQDFFAALADHILSEKAALAFTSETGDLLGERAIRVPFANASLLCQNILLLRYAEVRGVLRRVVSILKLRDSNFDPTIREVRIGGAGLVVGDPLRGVDQVLSGLPRTVALEGSLPTGQLLPPE